MIIDLLSHTGIRKGYAYSAEELIAMMDKAGVDKAMTASQLENIDNESTAQSVKRFPDRIIGFAVENPWAMGAEEDLEHAFRDNGLKGLKLNANRFGFAADRHSILDPFMQLCSKYHATIMAHAMSDLFSIPAKWEEMARTFPDVPIVLSHMGIPMMADSAFEIARRNKNIYLGTAVCFAPVVKRAIEEVGAEKVVFSSDAPFGSMSQEIQKIKYVTKDPAVQRMILGDNAQRLLNA